MKFLLIRHDLYILIALSVRALKEIRSSGWHLLQFSVLACLAMLVLFAARQNLVAIVAQPLYSYIAMLMTGVVSTLALSHRLVRFEEQSVVSSQTLRTQRLAEYSSVFLLSLFLAAHIGLLLLTVKYPVPQYLLYLGASFGFFLIGCGVSCLTIVARQLIHAATKRGVGDKSASQTKHLSQSSAPMFIQDPLASACVENQIVTPWLTKWSVFVPFLTALAAYLMLSLAAAGIDRTVLYFPAGALLFGFGLMVSKVDYKLTRFCTKVGIRFGRTIWPHCQLAFYLILALCFFAVVTPYKDLFLFFGIAAVVIALMTLYSIMRLAHFRYLTELAAVAVIQCELVIFGILLAAFFPAALALLLFRLGQVRKRLSHLYI